jgi:hypothetical protein
MSSSRRMLAATAADELKTSWPEVVGMGLVAAVAKIRGDRPDVHMQVHWVGESVDPGYDNDTRVLLFVNKDEVWTITETPVVG